MRQKFFKRFLARYHSNVIASGKVKPEEFTLEKLERDVIDYGCSRFGCIYLLLSL